MTDMKIRIYPSKARGEVAAPPSKSYAHRALICAALADGESVVHHLAFSKDIEATISCLRALGAEIRLEGDTAYITGVDLREAIGKNAELFCCESGSTLRFLIPLCLMSGERRVFRGSPYLFSRPLSVYEKIADENGFLFEKAFDSLTVAGKLRSGVYEVRGDISSQFISGLLFSLPLLDGDSELRILPPVESKPYIEMTVKALRDFGIEITQKANTFFIKGNQHYSKKEIKVEGDCSNAAFFEALNYAGSEVKIAGLNPDTIQGDRVFKILFEKIKNGDAPIDISDCPDLGPVLFAVSALCGGGRFTGTYRLKIKESDRANAMKQELSKLGVRMDVEENDVTVYSGELHPPTEPLFGHNDHRIVMAMSVLLTVTGGVIDGAQAVEKSFPDYFEKLQELGVKLTYGMDQ